MKIKKIKQKNNVALVLCVISVTHLISILIGFHFNRPIQY